MDQPGVFQLVTQLCRSITEKYESQNTSLLLPTKSKRHKDKDIKELRSLAYDILLFKSRPSGLNTDDQVANQELTGDPTTDVLSVAISRTINQQHQQAKKLSKCTDYLWKTGLCENPLVKNGLQLLLNLVDEGPEENNRNKGFLNIGYSFEPQISLNGEVPPYRHFEPEMFEGTHLLNSLYEGFSNISGEPIVYRTNPCPDADIYKVPGRGSTLYEYNDQDQSSFQYQFPSCMNFPEFDQLLPHTSECTVQEVSGQSEILSQSGVPEDSLILSDEFWEQVMNTSESSFKTWETAKDFCPAKEKPFLSEAPFSYIYDVMLAAQLKVPLEEKKQLKFTIVESNDLIRSLKFLMTGMESTMYSYNQEKDTFVIKDGVCLEGLLPDGVATLSKDFVDCGVCYRHLQHFSSYGQSRGFVFQAFCLSIGKYLRTYVATILSVDESITMLTFLADIQKLKMNLFYLCQLCRIKHEEILPTGGLLLTYLYQHIVHFSHQGLASVLLSCLRACSNVYLGFLEQWLFEGSCEDPYAEFFIQPDVAFTGDRTRMYWKNAFVLKKDTVPVFLRSLELAILNTGKAVNLMRLVVPRDPLLYLLQDSSPRLPCVMQLEDIPRLRDEYEAYRARVLSVTGPTVSMKQQFQRDRDKEKAFLDRVQQVRQHRIEAMRAVRDARAQQEILRKQVRLHEWEEQMKIVTARKELEKRRQKEMEAEIAEELKTRQREDDRMREEEKQKIIKHYKDLEDIIEQRRLYTEREILREQANYAGSNAAIEQDPVMALASVDEATANNNNSLLDNRPTLDRNLINSTEDVWNRNVGAPDISPTCDNILEATANFVNRTLGEEGNKKKKKSTSNTDLSTQARAKAGAKSASELNLASGTPDLSRRDSALRIRRRMLREEHPVGSNLAGLWGSEPTVHKAAESESEDLTPGETPTLKQLSRKSSTMLIKEKLLGLDYFGIKNLESASVLETIRSPTTPKHNLTLKITDSANVTASRNRNEAVTIKDSRSYPPKFSKQTGSWVGEPQESSEGSCELGVEASENVSFSLGSPSAAPQHKGTSPRVDYSRGLSVNSVSSYSLMTCKSSCSFVDTPSPSSSFLSSGLNTATLDQSAVTERGFFPRENVPTERDFVRTPPKAAEEPTFPVSPWLLFDRSWQSTVFERPMENIAERFLPANGADKKDDYSVDESLLSTLNVSSVSEIVRKSLMFPLQTHMTIVHDNVTRMWLVHEELLSHLHSLRNYYFLLDGEFGRSVTAALFERLGRVRKPRDLLNTDTLNAILANSLASSTDRHNKNCERLSFVVYNTPDHFRHASPNVLEDLNLGYKVGWPLNILITGDMLKKYSEVFRFLLKLWRTSWTLEDAFLRLKLLSKNRQITRSGHYQQLQLYRHMMSHIITAIHGYFMSTVLQATWMDFQRDLEAAATVDHIYRAHVAYIKKILTRGLLHSEAALFQSHLHNLFTLVLKFHGQLVSGRWTRNPKTQLHEHEHFAKLAEVFRQFQEMASFFARVTHKLAARGYNSHLFELHQKLNMNDYYAKQT